MKQRDAKLGQNHHVRTATRGQVLILFAVALVGLLGFTALSIDVGFLLAERRQVQSAADASALAAAQAALAEATDEVIVSSAQLYGSRNADVPEDDVVVNRPPVDGPFAGDDNYVQVSITKEVERFLLGVVYTGEWSVTATAVSGIEPEPFDAALLALNPDAGGIRTGGFTSITANGGSVVSNYNLRTSGNTTITTDQWITANNGFVETGSSNLNAGMGTNPNAPEIPDPLETLLQPPTLPSVPNNPVPTVNPQAQPCYSKTAWNTPAPPDFAGIPGTFSGGGGNCVRIDGSTSNTFVFPTGQYRFQNGAGVSLPHQGTTRIQGGTWNFNGGPGISIEGTTTRFEMRKGNYSFLNGADINISGNAPSNHLGTGGTVATDSTFYFSGGGGIDSGGSNHITMNPGTYIFDGGPGIHMHGSTQLTFNPGTYVFWFNNGADFRFSGSSVVVLNGDVHVRMYFKGNGGNPSNLQMEGNADFSIPPGEYYFDNGQFRNTGTATISGDNVFLYFTNGGYLHSTGSARFRFTAPETEIYPGYYPGVFIYSDRSNTATFTWQGVSAGGIASRGVIYIPSGQLTMGGYSAGVQIEGQIIVDNIQTSGNTMLGITYEHYVDTTMPAFYLVQ